MVGRLPEAVEPYQSVMVHQHLSIGYVIELLLPEILDVGPLTAPLIGNPAPSDCADWCPISPPQVSSRSDKNCKLWSKKCKKLWTNSLTAWRTSRAILTGQLHYTLLREISFVYFTREQKSALFRSASKPQRSFRPKKGWSLDCTKFHSDKTIIYPKNVGRR